MSASVFAVTSRGRGFSNQVYLLTVVPIMSCCFYDSKRSVKLITDFKPVTAGDMLASHCVCVFVYLSHMCESVWVCVCVFVYLSHMCESVCVCVCVSLS